jgi:vanillate/3-O-methylgallate O-demethylase
VVNFDHDFVGREALERTAGEDQRQKVTLVWDPADVARVVESYMRPEETPPLYIEFPRATYSTWQYDAVHDDQGERRGLTPPASAGTTGDDLTRRRPEYATPGTQVSVIWGERMAGPEPLARAHRQMEIRAAVVPTPIGK